MAEQNDREDQRLYSTTEAQGEHPANRPKLGIGDALDQIKEAAVAAGAHVRETALEEGGEAVERGKEGIAGQIDKLVSAIDASARELHTSQSSLAPMVDSVAGYLRNAAQQLHEENPRALAEEVSGFARTHPLMFLLGSAAAGFALARVAKASDTAHGNPRDRI